MNLCEIKDVGQKNEKAFYFYLEFIVNIIALKNTFLALCPIYPIGWAIDFGAEKKKSLIFLKSAEREN